MNITQHLETMSKREGSDLFISSKLRPSMKLHGQLVQLADDLYSAQEAKDAVLSLMDAPLQKEFLETKEANFAYHLEDVGRFRVSAYFYRSECGMVIRRISEQIPSFETLDLPDTLKPLIMAKRGLVIIIGATGHGKTTTLASMLDYRNQSSSGHIISLEDPIEYIHEHKKSIFTQREVGLDTDSYDIALKNALRQSPDVINISEIRCANTMQAAMSFSETGHLCLATLHANNANQALDRIIHFFPKEMHQQIWLDLSLNLRAIIGQQLIPSIDGKSRALAMEILVNSPVIANHIRKGEVEVLKEYMSRKNQYGMKTFDQALFDLLMGGKISYEEALNHADSANDLRLLIKLAQGDTADPSTLSLGGSPREVKHNDNNNNNPGLDLLDNRDY